MSKPKTGSAIGKPPASAPLAARIPHRMTAHGQTRVDDYFWLRDRGDPKVVEYLTAENTHTEEALRRSQPLKDRLLGEMKARIPANETSVPYRDGDYFYYHRYEEGREYPIYCRRQGSLAAAEQVLLDVNEMAVGHDYFALRNFTVSPDHRRAVFCVDTEGRRFFTLRFVNLRDGELLHDKIPDVSSNYAWASDSRTLLYTRQDRDTLRDYQVLRHVVGGGVDTLVYQEDDDTNWLSVERSLSGRYLFLSSIATISTEVRCVRADKPDHEPMLIQPREANHEYYVTDGVDRLFILSNDGAKNFRVMEAPLDCPAKEHWREVVEHRDDVLIDGMEVFEGHVVLSNVVRGLDQIEIVDRGTQARFSIEFEEAAYSVYPSGNHRYSAAELRYTYESLTTPESTYDFDLPTRRHTLIKEQAVPGGFDRRDYQSERMFVVARDGAAVPVSLVYRKGFVRDGSQPLLLYGYGSYGIGIDADFDLEIFSLLDRGFVYAIAHIRGGSELGRQWYYDGRQFKKANTFNDFVDVTRHLIAAGYTSSEHCYASGGSAGGLLIGAVANLAPELYNGMATRVPFVDVVTTMLDESIPLTTGEFDEWGNPADKSSYDYMLSYSPYDNVREQEYPNLLVTTGLYDSQVQYWEPAKWVAKLRAKKTDENLVLLWTDMQAGHSGKTGRYRSLEDTALVYAFFLMLEGIEY